MRILLVEDDEAIGMGLTYSLEKEGYEVVTAKNAADARAAWKPETYDICVLDINLPDGSGYDLCRQITGIVLFNCKNEAHSSNAHPHCSLLFKNI